MVVSVGLRAADHSCLRVRLEDHMRVVLHLQRHLTCQCAFETLLDAVLDHHLLVMHVTHACLRSGVLKLLI